MNISENQSQLLRQLTIKPLQARSGFFSESLTRSPTFDANTAELFEPENTVLSTDIKLLLAQTVIRHWLLDPKATSCYLANDNTLLITPLLTTLQQPAIKQQLWIVLQPLQVNDAD
jgi:hypothetical protein